MFYFISLLLLSLSLSADSFSAGIAYGMRRIYFPRIALVILGMCSGGIIFFAMWMGNQLSKWLPHYVTSWIGAVILILLGGITLSQAKKTSKEAAPPYKEESVSWIRFILQVFKKPTTADIDHSQYISSKEALFLGIALSLDSFGAGLAAAMMGISPIMISSVIALSSPLLFVIGMSLGSQIKGTHRLSIIAGALLILLGVLRLFS